MQQEKGQIEIILVIAIIGIVIFLSFSKSGLSGLNFGSTPATSPATQDSSSETPSNYYSNPVPNTAPPFRYSPQPSGGLFSGTRETYLTLYTDENATCRYATVSGVAYESMQYTFSGTGGVFHSTLVTGLNEGGFYTYYVKCVDTWGNKNNDDFTIAFWVNSPIDYTPPVLSNAYPSGETLPASAFETTIGVSTNEPASCRYSRVQGVSYNSMGNSLSSDGTGRYHTARITGLVAGATYNYFVRCKDSSGNVNTGDVMISFTASPQLK